MTGGLELGRRTSARYVVAAEDHVEFDRYPARDGAELHVGGMRIRVVATPGHTDTHLSYRVDDGTGPGALFTGGSLLYGSVGRTDLVDAARTEEPTHAQYCSPRRSTSSRPCFPAGNRLRRRSRRIRHAPARRAARELSTEFPRSRTRAQDDHTEDQPIT